MCAEFNDHACPAESRALQFEVHGRDAYGNECPLPPKSVTLHALPESAMSADYEVAAGHLPSVVTVSATVLYEGAVCVLPPRTWHMVYVVVSLAVSPGIIGLCCLGFRR